MSEADLPDVRDNYQLLGPTRMLTGKHLTTFRHYRAFGFMCRYNVIKPEIIHAAKLSDMKKRFIASATKTPIFNISSEGEVILGDDKRLQIVSKDRIIYNDNMFSTKQKELLRTSELEVTKIAAELLNTTIGQLENIESVLLSKEGLEEPQEPHRDLPQVFADTAALALVCLEDDTTLLLARKSHLGNRLMEKRYIARYGLSIGDVLIFHPRLVHAGDLYYSSNLRLHYYVLPRGSGWETDQTYFLDAEERSMISFRNEDIERNERAAQSRRKPAQHLNLRKRHRS